MGRELDVWAGGGDVAQVAAGAGAATSFDDMEFTGRAPVPADVPTVFFDNLAAEPAPSAEGAIASGASELVRPVAIGEERFQVREYWHAFPEQVVLSRAMRGLRRRPDGKLAPEGRWLLADRTTFRTAGGVSQQARMVDDTTSGGQAGVVRADSGDMPSGFVAGAFAQSALPGRARMWLNQQVPGPTRWLGSVLRWSDGTETVDVLRGDDATFVVVHASRQVGGLVWDLVRRELRVVGEPTRVSVLPKRARGLTGGRRVPRELGR